MGRSGFFFYFGARDLVFKPGGSGTREIRAGEVIVCVSRADCIVRLGERGKMQRDTSARGVDRLYIADMTATSERDRGNES